VQGFSDAARLNLQLSGIFENVIFASFSKSLLIFTIGFSVRDFQLGEVV